MRNTPLRAFASPLKNKNKVRTDSTLTFDPDTLKVDSTPIGQRKVRAAGYGFSSEKGGEASMWKQKRDEIATKKATQKVKDKSSKSKFGSGGKRMIMPGN